MPVNFALYTIALYLLTATSLIDDEESYATAFACEPIQKLFKFGDGEKVVAAMSLDPRVTAEEDVVLLAATRSGLVLRHSLDAFREATTRSGRRYAKPAEGDEVVFVAPCAEGDVVALVSESGRAILFDSSEVPVLSGPGRGVLGIKLAAGDRLVGAALAVGLALDAVVDERLDTVTLDWDPRPSVTVVMAVTGCTEPSGRVIVSEPYPTRQ